MLGPLEQQVVQFLPRENFPTFLDGPGVVLGVIMIRPMLAYYVLACLIEIKSILVDPMTISELF